MIKIILTTIAIIVIIVIAFFFYLLSVENKEQKRREDLTECKLQCRVELSEPDNCIEKCIMKYNQIK
ncbi:hypothetical protein KKC65_02885 [Patescibacteria group bacterium]|nr:hypothetical protein [Patescibacteria group bacterium]